jgi:hypothetical protein
MIARQHANNDTAYFTEQGKQTPTTARLNDVVAGRFRLISISAERAIFEDTGLGFKHTLAMQQATRGAPQFGDGQPVRGGGFPPGSGYIPNPSIMNPNVNANPPTRIPGIPDNIPRVNTPANARPQRDDSKKDDSKDDDDGDTDNR